MIDWGDLPFTPWQKVLLEILFANPKEAEMTVQTQKYVRKPLYIDAVQISSTNFEEVAKWVEGPIRTSDRGTYIQVRVHRPVSERQTQGYIGDWILDSGNGFKVYTNKAFHSSFEELDGTAKDAAVQAEKLLAEHASHAVSVQDVYEKAGIPSPGSVKDVYEKGWESKPGPVNNVFDEAVTRGEYSSRD